MNNIRFKIIAGKINKIPEFYTIFAKNTRLYNNTTRSRPGRDQMFVAEAEAEASRPRQRPRPKCWPRGHFGLCEDLTSLDRSLMRDWIGWSSVLRPHQHIIGYMGDGFYRSKDPTNSIKVLKENLQRKTTQRTKKTQNTHMHTHTNRQIGLQHTSITQQVP